MPGSLGGLDTNGVWQYGEIDYETTFSAMLNKGQVASSTQFGLLKAQIAARDTTVWTTYVSTLTGITLGTGGSKLMQYTRIGGRYLVRYKIVLGTAGILTGIPKFTLPVAAAAIPHIFAPYAGNGSLLDASSGLPKWSMVVRDNASTTVVRISQEGYTDISGTAPWTWAINDVMQGEFWMDAA